jgi:hypothetical protein
MTSKYVAETCAMTLYSFNLWSPIRKSTESDTVSLQELCQLSYIWNLTSANFSSALKAVHSFTSVIIYLSRVSSSNSTNGSTKCTAPARNRSKLSCPRPVYRALHFRTSTKEFNTTRVKEMYFDFLFLLSPFCVCLWKFPGQHFLPDSEEWPKSKDVEV